MSIAARKIAALVRCAEQARKFHADAGTAFKQDHLYQDAAVLNVTRACEATIDLANILARQRRLDVIAEAREAFDLIERAGLIDADLKTRLQKMIGSRNIAVRQYQELNLDIVESVIKNGLEDLLKFAEAVRPHISGS